MLSRILLDPTPTDMTGGVLTSTPTPTPETITTRESGGVSSGVTQGDRNFLADDPVADSSATMAQTPAPLTPADPNQAAGASDYTSVRDAAKLAGYTFDREYEDDESAFRAIVQQAQANKQADYYAQLGQRLAPHAGQIKDYLAQQQKPQAQAQERKSWEAPEYDSRWVSGCVQDPATGMILAKPGFPPENATKLAAYLEWKENYDSNPSAVIAEMVNAKATELFDQKFAERSAEQDRKSSVSSIVAENASWFNATDAQGRPVYANGRPQPSQLGAAYLGHVRMAYESGIHDPKRQDMIAKKLLQGDLAQSQLAKLNQAGQSSAPPSAFSSGTPNVNPAATLTPAQRASNPFVADPSTNGQSLSDIMRRQFQEQGITDADFAVMG